MSKTKALTKTNAGLSKVTMTEAAASLEGWQVDPVVHQLKEEGDCIEGWFEGPGRGLEIEDRASGEVRTIPTWILSFGPSMPRVAFTGAHQVNKFLEEMTSGAYVRIIRGQTKQQAGKARQITEYLCAVNPDLSRSK